jgi:hypothetical protein
LDGVDDNDEVLVRVVVNEDAVNVGDRDTDTVDTREYVREHEYELHDIECVVESVGGETEMLNDDDADLE